MRSLILLAVFISAGCAAFKKDAVTVFNDARTASSKFCADEPNLKASGLLAGQIAKDADKFCQGVAFATAVSIPAAGGAPAK